MLCRRVARRIAVAMRRPQSCRVTIGLDEASAESNPITVKVPGAATSADIILGERVRGRVSAEYADDEPFDADERHIVQGAAAALRTWLARQDALDSVQLSEERLRSMVAQLPGLVWTADHSLVMTSCNGAAFGDLEVEPEELVGRPVTEILGAQAQDEVLAAMRAALSRGGRLF